MLKVLLIVVQGKPEGKVIPLVGPVFRVGRDESCHLRPNSVEVSRQHTEVSITDDKVTVRDLGSRNGTRVNGKLLTAPHELKSGELLQIGPLTFAVTIQGATVSGMPPRPVAAGSKSASLDEIPGDQIDSWLIADNARPTPDRPSGVYDGDTLTISAFREATKSQPAPVTPPAASVPPAAKTPPAAAAPKSVPPPKPVPAPAPPPAPAKTPVHVEVPEPVAEAAPEITAPASTFFVPEEFEQLEEGIGDGDPMGENEEDEATAEEEQIAQDMMDESNPFYIPKKPKSAEASQAKPELQDSSMAANDILRKMLDRRRASKS